LRSQARAILNRLEDGGRLQVCGDGLVRAAFAGFKK
jgi:hypothetical protein